MVDPPAPQRPRPDDALRYCRTEGRAGRDRRARGHDVRGAAPPKGEPDESGDDAPSIPEQLLTLSSDDSVTLVHTDTAEERWQEVADLIDRTLAAAVDQFSRKLG